MPDNNNTRIVERTNLNKTILLVDSRCSIHVLFRYGRSVWSKKNNSINYGIMFVGFTLAGYFGPTVIRSVLQREASYQNVSIIAAINHYEIPATARRSQVFLFSVVMDRAHLTND